MRKFNWFNINKSTVIQYTRTVYALLHNGQTVQECDATMPHSTTKAGLKKKHRTGLHHTCNRIPIGLFLLAFLIASCERDSESRQYEALVQHELSRGERCDSLFRGVYFGMTAKQFFAHCWQMNREGLFFDGTNHDFVLFRLNHQELKSPVSMNFRPEFYNDKIYNMQATYQYDSWAPWNKNTFSDSLLPDVVHLFSIWYAGNSFIKMTDKRRGTIYVKVDGNRRITVGRFDDTFVKADFTDLTIEKQLKK